MNIRHIPLGEDESCPNQVLPFHLDGATILESQFFFDEKAARRTV